MIAMIVADADVLDLLGLEVELSQEVDQARLRRGRAGAHRVAGVPDHVLIAMLDEIAAEDQLQLQVTISIGVGEPEIYFRRRLRGAAVEARESDFRLCLRRSRKADERVGAHADRQQAENSLHWFPPEISTKTSDQREMLPGCLSPVNARACRQRLREREFLCKPRRRHSPTSPGTFRSHQTDMMQAPLRPALSGGDDPARVGSDRLVGFRPPIDGTRVTPLPLAQTRNT